MDDKHHILNKNLQRDHKESLMTEPLIICPLPPLTRNVSFKPLISEKNIWV